MHTNMDDLDFSDFNSTDKIKGNVKNNAFISSSLWTSLVAQLRSTRQKERFDAASILASKLEIYQKSLSKTSVENNENGNSSFLDDSTPTKKSKSNFAISSGSSSGPMSVDEACEFCLLSKELLINEEDAYFGKVSLKQATLPEITSITFNKTWQFIKDILFSIKLIFSYHARNISSEIYLLLQSLLSYLNDYYRLLGNRSPFTVHYLKFIYHMVSIPLVLYEMPGNTMWKNMLLCFIKLSASEELSRYISKIESNLCHGLDAIHYLSLNHDITTVPNYISSSGESIFIIQTLCLLIRCVSFNTKFFETLTSLALYEFLLCHPHESSAHQNVICTLTSILVNNLSRDYCHQQLSGGTVKIHVHMPPYFLELKEELSLYSLRYLWTSKSTIIWNSCLKNISIALMDPFWTLDTLMMAKNSNTSWLDILIENCLKELEKPKNFSRIVSLVNIPSSSLHTFPEQYLNGLFSETPEIPSSGILFFGVIYYLFRFLFYHGLKEKIKLISGKLREILFNVRTPEYTKLFILQFLLISTKFSTNFFPFEALFLEIYEHLSSFSPRQMCFAVPSIVMQCCRPNKYQFSKLWKFLLFLLRRNDTIEDAFFILLGIYEDFIVPHKLTLQLYDELNTLFSSDLYFISMNLVQIYQILSVRIGDPEGNFKRSFVGWSRMSILKTGSSSQQSKEETENFVMAMKKLGLSFTDLDDFQSIPLEIRIHIWTQFNLTGLISSTILSLTDFKQLATICPSNFLQVEDSILEIFLQKMVETLEISIEQSKDIYSNPCEREETFFTSIESCRRIFEFLRLCSNTFTTATVTSSYKNTFQLFLKDLPLYCTELCTETPLTTYIFTSGLPGLEKNQFELFIKNPTFITILTMLRCEPQFDNSIFDLISSNTLEIHPKLVKKFNLMKENSWGSFVATEYSNVNIMDAFYFHIADNLLSSPSCFTLSPIQFFKLFLETFSHQIFVKQYCHIYRRLVSIFYNCFDGFFQRDHSLYRKYAAYYWIENSLLHKSCRLDNLPFEILYDDNPLLTNYEFSDFIEKYQTELSPILLYFHDKIPSDLIAIREENKLLVYEKSFSLIVAQAFPLYFNGPENSSLRRRSIERADFLLYKTLRNCLGQINFDALFIQKLPEILAYLIYSVESSLSSELSNSFSNFCDLTTMTRYSKREVEEAFNHISKMLGFSEIFFHSNSFSSHGSKHLIFSSVGRFSAIFFYYLELIEMDWMAFKNSLDLMIRLKYLEYFLFASEKTPQSSSFFMYFLLANLYSINAVVDNVLIEWARDKISTLQGNTFYRLALASLSNIDKLSEEVAEFWKRDHFSLIFTHDLLLELVSRFFKLWTTHKSLFQPMFIFFRENGRFIASYFSRYPEILYGLKEIFQELSLFASPRKSPENDIFQLDVVGCCLVPTLKILISWKESNDECTKQDFVFFQRLFWLIASNEVLRESLSELLFFSTFDFVLNHCKKFNTFPFKSLEVAAIVPISRGHFFLKLMNLSASLYLKINTERTVLVFYHLLGIDISGLTKLALECTGSTESGEAAFYYWNLYKDLVASELLDYKDPPAKEIEMDSLKLLILSKLKSIDASCIDSIPFSGIYGLRNIVENFPTSLICSSSSLNSYFSANVSLDVLRTWDLPDLVSIERIRKMSDKDLAFEYLRNLTPLKMEESLELVTLRLESAARNDELRAQELSKFASFIKDDLLVKFEEAKWIYESSQNCMLAISWLKSALSPILCPSVESLKNISYQTRVKIIKSLAFLGKCASDTKSYRPHEIYDEYYKPLEFLLRIPSIASLGVIPESFSIGDTSTPLIRAQDIYFQLATFYDQQYESRISSSELQAWSSLLRSKAEELAALKCKRPVKGSSLERAINLMQIQLDNDRSSYEKILVDANTYLFKSIENYLNALLLRGTGVSAPCLLEISMNQVEISSAFRLCTLWIKHSDMLPISRLLQEFLLTPGFPWKSFMPLMYQIVARLENKVNPFQEALQCLVEGLLERFPYVSVFHLLYFKSKNPMSSDSSKAILVKEIIDKVKNKSAKLHSVLTEMELLISAYVELSTMDIKSVAIGGGSSNHSLEGTSLMRFLEHGKGNVPVLTGDFSAFFKGNPSYGESIQGITTIAAFRPTIKLVGGMNLPKVIDCVGSDGKIYRQLVKSKDDLRQDAIMSQLFCIFNGLFSHADQAPGFCVKTYKVIPLQPLSGVLEWLSSTMPVGDYLQETHERYGPSRPSELSPTQARVLAKKEFDHPRSTPTTKLEIYKEKILPRFHPVFRFFFYESAQASETWYTKRLTFTRSLAISSILGYIVGLGDRHTQNILLDLSTSEICQIDLNLIFEQGKLLKIPERVPFRLTPDFRDGLSFGGPYHGTFPKTCEAALTILRERKDLVLAILKVVEWDPLYKWQFVIEKTTSGATTKRTLGNTVVNDKKENYVYTTQQPAMLLAREMSCIAQQENPPYLDGCLTTPKCTQTQRQQGRLYDQNDMDTLQPINPEAERALLRVREKLQGLEEGNTLSVSAQTQYLIETAASESNLSQMYYGWQPWM